MWYAAGGGGPVFPLSADGTRPNYGATPTYTQPYLAGGGGQATMPGPFYRYDEDGRLAPTKFPEFWDQKWFFDDNNRGADGARGRP